MTFVNHDAAEAVLALEPVEERPEAVQDRGLAGHEDDGAVDGGRGGVPDGAERDQRHDDHGGPGGREQGGDGIVRCSDFLVPITERSQEFRLLFFIPLGIRVRGYDGRGPKVFVLQLGG